MEFSNEIISAKAAKLWAAMKYAYRKQNEEDKVIIKSRMHAAKLKPNQKEQNFIDYIVKSK
jgi:hypothetical protein